MRTDLHEEAMLKVQRVLAAHRVPTSTLSKHDAITQIGEIADTWAQGRGVPVFVEKGQRDVLADLLRDTLAPLQLSFATTVLTDGPAAGREIASLMHRIKRALDGLAEQGNVDSVPVNAMVQFAQSQALFDVLKTVSDGVFSAELPKMAEVPMKQLREILELLAFSEGEQP